MITTFSDFLKMASEQTNPQRLLFLFASATANQKTQKRDEQHGEITPIMCVDKLLTELTSFADLTSEADGVSKDWDFVFIAALAGENQQAPSSEEAEIYLNNMTNDIASGQDVGRYLIFDRNENPIIIEAA